MRSVAAPTSGQGRTAAPPAGTRPPTKRVGTHFTLEWADGHAVLHEGENVIGREEDAVAWIESASVSRRHARIVVREGKATLEDLGSKNGTFARGQKVTAPLVLVDDEEIRVGLVPLRVRIFAAETSTRTAAKE